MKTCPVCGFKKPAPPPKLSDLHKKILAYCHVPRMTGEIADYVLMDRNALYKHLRLLQRLDVMEKRSSDFGVASYFVATNRPIAWEPDFMTHKPQVMGVAL
jgi:hypothetical protein